jgi:hypothetical protein
MQHESRPSPDTPHFDFSKVIFWGVVAVTSSVVLLVALEKFF